MSDPLIIHWFRRDLRLADNPALARAAARGRVLPVYIHDLEAPRQWSAEVCGTDEASPGSASLGGASLGGASLVGLHLALASLSRSLSGHLRTFAGDAVTTLRTLVTRHGATAVSFCRAYEPWQRQQDDRVAQMLRGLGVEVMVEEGRLLFAPEAVLKADGSPYKVFTPFYRRGCLAAPAPRRPLPPPRLDIYTPSEEKSSCPMSEDLHVMPTGKWAERLAGQWTLNEAHSQHALKHFINTHLAGYKKGRDYPARAQVSRLSPALHFGLLSPNQIWHAVRALEDTDDVDHFCAELCWREFSYHLLYHHPDMMFRNINATFDAFPWRSDDIALERWQRGQTGFPIVDAGMRELWQTGYMHNRVRMIVASFLTKNMLINWRFGARWFQDCLLDADPANNSASWQWVAGSGMDAAPYFRIFNPVTQSRKFDPDGTYIRRYIPELAALDARDIHTPWHTRTGALCLSEKQDYPRPMIDLKASRQRALDAFRYCRNGAV